MNPGDLVTDAVTETPDSGGSVGRPAIRSGHDQPVATARRIPHQHRALDEGRLPSPPAAPGVRRRESRSNGRVRPVGGRAVRRTERDALARNRRQMAGHDRPLARRDPRQYAATSRLTARDPRSLAAQRVEPDSAPNSSGYHDRGHAARPRSRRRAHAGAPVVRSAGLSASAAHGSRAAGLPSRPDGQPAVAQRTGPLRPDDGTDAERAGGRLPRPRPAATRRRQRADRRGLMRHRLLRRQAGRDARRGRQPSLPGPGPA